MHPDISETAVLGVPDAVWGEVGLAVCVCAGRCRYRRQRLKAYLEGKMARYKLPKTVVFLGAMPKSAYGKITKKMIREELGKRGQLPLFDEKRTG